MFEQEGPRAGAWAASEQLRGFLRFTVEQNSARPGDQIKEYVVGVEVFGRGNRSIPYRRRR